jgi:hypothetical protein
VSFHVPSSHHVVEPVAEEFAENSSHDGSEVEETFSSINIIKLCLVKREIKHTNLTQSKVIQRSHEDAERGINTHHPSKSKAIIKHAQKNRRFNNHNPRSHKCLPRRTPLLPTMPLFNAYQSLPTGLWDGTFSGWNVAVVEGFVDEEGDEDEAETS